MYVLRDLQHSMLGSTLHVAALLGLHFTGDAGHKKVS
jgi:hypothetical protein